MNKWSNAVSVPLSVVPGHALHAKVLQKHKGVGPLFSCHAQRACFVPQLNRLSTTGQQFISFLHLFCANKVSFVRASGKTLKRLFFDPLESTRDLFFLGEKFCWHPILPNPARPPRRAPRPDLPVVCPGFNFGRFLDLPGMERVYSDNKASVHLSAARKKESFSSRV